MKHQDFTLSSDGFVGRLSEPDEGSDKAVILIMGGKQSLLSIIKFTDYGILKDDLEVNA